jgi:hypothetical protein
MSLDRSVSGLLNRDLFSTEVELFVYTEGGGQQTQTLEEPSGTLDEYFWRRLFGLYLPQKKQAKFISVGCKPKLLKIYEKIKSDTQSIYNICLDSDYDDFKNCKILDNKVYYSYGYSWENDIFETEVLTLYVKKNCMFNGENDDLILSINELKQLADEKLIPHIKKDIAYNAAGKLYLDKRRRIAKLSDDSKNIEFDNCYLDPVYNLLILL